MSIQGDVSHVEVRGFIMQRYAGGNGGVATSSKGKGRPSHIRVADNEIRFTSGQSGISFNHTDHVEAVGNFIHHCPGWTVGIYINRVNNYKLLGNRLDTNSGSGIRHYEAKTGELRDNILIDHKGMHSSGLNFYVGCRDIVMEDNYVQNVVALNRSLENFTFRNNVLDSVGSNTVGIAMWQSGDVGGNHMKNITIENNTVVNVDPSVGWATSIFVQGNKNLPQNLVVRNNIVELLRNEFPGTVERNIHMREGSEMVGPESMVVTDPSVLFMDPDAGDYRRKPGGPMMEVGASVPPPPPAEEWKASKKSGY